MKNGSKVLIVILSLLLIGSCSYIVYDKFFSTNKKQETTKKETATQQEKTEDKKVLETTDEKVGEVYNSLFNNVLDRYCGYFKYFEKDKVLANDIPNEDAFAMVAGRLYKDNGDNNYTEETVRNELNKTFGKNYQFQNQDYKTCPSWKYDATNKKYILEGAECGGTCGPDRTRTRITKVLENTNTIEVYTRVLFYQSNNNYYSSDYNGTNKIEITSYNSEYSIEDKDYAKGGLFKMIFTKEDGNYIFTSSESVK